MRYLRMLSNSVIASGVASGYLTTLFLQLNPAVSIEPSTLIPLAAVLAIAYGANLTVVFYALIVFRQLKQLTQLSDDIAKVNLSHPMLGLCDPDPSKHQALRLMWVVQWAIE